MPMVTRYPCPAVSTAARTASRKASSSRMRWSAAKDPTTASGSRSAMIAAARPMAPMVPRAEGSTITDA